jgi:hypothetical protein
VILLSCPSPEIDQAELHIKLGQAGNTLFESIVDYFIIKLKFFSKNDYRAYLLDIKRHIEADLFFLKNVDVFKVLGNPNMDRFLLPEFVSIKNLNIFFFLFFKQLNVVFKFILTVLLKLFFHFVRSLCEITILFRSWDLRRCFGLRILYIG